MVQKAKKQAESLKQRVQELSKRAPISRELDNPVPWITEHLHFDAWPHQVNWLQDHAVLSRVLRKARKIGATTVCIAAEAIWRCLRKPEQCILIVTPSERQSVLVVFKAVSDVLSGSDAYVQGQILNVTKTCGFHERFLYPSPAVFAG